MFLRYNKFYDISTTEHIIKPGRSPCPSTQVRNTVGGVNILVLTLANVGDKFTFYKRITIQELQLFVSQPSNIRLLLTLPYWEFLTRQFKLWAHSGNVGINYHKVRIIVRMELVWKCIDLCTTYNKPRTCSFQISLNCINQHSTKSEAFIEVGVVGGLELW